MDILTILGYIQGGNGTLFFGIVATLVDYLMKIGLLKIERYLCPRSAIPALILCKRA